MRSKVLCEDVCDHATPDTVNNKKTVETDNAQLNMYALGLIFNWIVSLCPPNPSRRQ